MVELSRDYTQDLLQDSIGEPIFEVTLEVSFNPLRSFFKLQQFKSRRL